jgi:hypothetical protein
VKNASNGFMVVVLYCKFIRPSTLNVKTNSNANAVVVKRVSNIVYFFV